MLRHRTISASPQRTASGAWQVIAELVADTLDRSPDIDRADVQASLDRAARVGLMLVAGGHLEKHRLTLVAGELTLELSTVSGEDAISLEENLNPVPGAAQATDWTLYLPAAEPHTKLISEISASDSHLSDAEPATPVSAAALNESALVDEDVLARWAQE